jgi:hypothetical protein
METYCIDQDDPRRIPNRDYGGIGATLVHIANAQESYAAKVLDRQRPKRLSEHPFPGFDALGEAFARGNAQLEHATSVPGLDREVQVTDDDPPATWTMPVGLFLLQRSTMRPSTVRKWSPS